MPEPDPDDEADDGGARPFWSGTISFGLVSIPVNLFSASRPGGVHLRLLGPDGAPLRRIYVCPQDGQELGREDIVRGYRLESGELVEVTDEELERLEPEKSRDIDLRRFVPEDELDPLFFERGYVLGPAGESTKAYRLLAATMERTGRAGIATFVMRGKEHLVAITSQGGLLRCETLRFADEVRSPEDIGLPGRPDEVPAEPCRRLAKAVEALCRDRLEPGELVDEHAAQVRELARQKADRGEAVVQVEEPAAEEGGGGAVDLMQLIQKSLAAREARPRRARTKREAARKRKATKGRASRARP